MYQQIKEIEKLCGYDMTVLELMEKTEKESEKDDPWSNLELPCVDTGIEDLSINHDYYLYRMAD